MVDGVRLVVVDVDGCITPGEAGAWDWQAVRAMQQINHRAHRNAAAPAITLCTGRQEPYVEALMQAIGGFVPCIYENGGGMYLPDGYRFLEHPAITAQMRKTLLAAKSRLFDSLVAAGLAYFQPGKEVSITCYPLPGTSLAALEQRIRLMLHDYEGTVTIHTSATCIDVTPAGIDKGAGVRWLAEQTLIPIEDMGGVGDSPSDLAFLGIVGACAAPANARPEVKNAVQYVSPYRNGRGVIDIIRHWQQSAPSP